MSCVPDKHGRLLVFVCPTCNIHSVGDVAWWSLMDTDDPTLELHCDNCGDGVAKKHRLVGFTRESMTGEATELKKLMTEATPLPWIHGLSERDASKRKVNERLFVHAVNMLPKLIQALEESQLVLMEYGGKDDERYTLERRTAYRRVTAVIVEANNPKVQS